MKPATRDWLDAEPPTDPSKAQAYWCEMNYFMHHTATGGHLPCDCSEGKGHNDPRSRDPEFRRAAA